MDSNVERQPLQPSPRRTQGPPLADLRLTPLANISRQRAADVAHAEDRHQINAANFGSNI